MVISWELGKISYFEIFLWLNFAKKRDRCFFFYSKRKSGEKWPFQKLIFPHFSVFFIFLWPAQKPQIWCRYRLKSDSLTFKSSLHSIERKKSWKNHFEHKIHWVFAGFEHKQRNIKLSYQNWNFDEKFWFSVFWEVLAGKFLMSLNFVKSWDLIQFCCTEVDTTLGLTSFEIS